MTRLHDTCDIAIIGGGVVGCSIARELSRYQLDIVLLERELEVGFGTSKTNSGIVHAGHHSPIDTLKGQLVVRGNAMFDQLEDELGFGFRRVGEIVVARDQEQVATLEALHALGEQKGVPGLEMWDQRRLRMEEPNLSHKLVAALYAPSAGVVNPYELVFALVESAIENGVEVLVQAPVQSIDQDPDGGPLVLHTPKGTVAARHVINCAGVFADHVAAMVGLDDFAIHPRKGEEYMLDGRLEGIVKRLVFPVPGETSKGVLIIPTFDGTIMVGPTAVETDDRYDKTTSYEGAKAIFDSVRALCPAIHPRDTISEFAGLRAAATGGDFIIGPTRVPGFINVAGIQSPGLTAAPAIAEMVRDIMISEGVSLNPKDRWKARVERPPRFAHQSRKRRRALVEQDPLFGKMVCRCEMITEAEIHRAIDHGARTLDGVKFRTRAGMGRCQGGFCTTRVMEILSERLGIPFEQVSKRGGDSWLVTPMDERDAGGESCSAE